VDTNNSLYSSVNGVLFDKSQFTLLEYPGGLAGSYTIPGTVTSIGDYAFDGCANLTGVTIPNSVTDIGEFAFGGCTSLSSVYFTGNAPNTVGANLFYDDDNATVYYLSGATGWSSTFAGIPAVLWNPLILTGDGNFGVQSNQFGFDITNTGNANITVVVEVCTDLTSSVWFPLQTVTLTNGLFYFSEPLQTNSSGRFYGLGLPCGQCGGALQVMITPSDAVSAGAGWQVDGGAWQPGGAMAGLSAGAHTVQFSNIAGWNTPSNQIVTITNGFLTTATGNYTGQGGTLQVTIAPSDAVSAGAVWQVDGGAWQPNGATAGLSAGPHTVQFSNIAGWNTPSNQLVTITNGFLTTATGNYTGQGGTLQVTITPLDAMSAGAGWEVDGGAWETNGATAGLSAGAHTVQFSTIAGWNTPSNQIVTITNGFLTTAMGNYTAQSSYPYGYTANAGAITITAYSGSGGAVTIPSTINGLPVASIGQYAFASSSNLTCITIPATVTNIGEYAFFDCASLTGVYFYGNAPSADATVFSGDTNATAYYLPGATGWDDFSANTGLPTALWTPLIQASGANFGVQSNQFGFNIIWASGMVVVVDVCTDLTSSVWFPLQTVTLTNGCFYFSEPVQTNSSCRFFGLGLPCAQCGGTLQVTISPSDAVSTGAEWQVDGGAWESGGAMARLSAGAHTVQFSNIAGWNTPSNQIVTITNGFLTTATGNYTEQSSYPYGYTANAGAMTITAYSGSRGAVAMPPTINGLPVASIGQNAFASCSNLTWVRIPATVTNIGEDAFSDCASLTGVYFHGNAPSADATVFSGDTNATAYYLPGATGWDDFSVNTGLPTALWTLQVQTSGTNFGVQSNLLFGFNIIWASGMVIEVDVCTNLTNPVWTSLQTVTLSNDWFYFSEALQTNCSGRFYRISSP
jgi:hypothetical protein